MNADHECLFVVAPVEDTDAAPLGKTPGSAPEKIMIQFLGGRLFEREYLATGRIDAGHDGANRPVFSRTVHCLKDQQHSITVMRIHDVLKIVDLLHERLFDCSILSFPTQRLFQLRRIIRQIDLGLSGDSKFAGVNVTVQLPGKALDEVPKTVAFARELKQAMLDKYPDIEIRLVGMAVMNKNHHLSKPVLIGEIQEDGQFLVVSETDDVVPGDAWSDFLPGSKDVIADWTAPISCGNYNTVSKTCSGQVY